MKQSSLPGSRLGRIGHLGKLAGGLAGGMIGEGLKQLASGQRPSRHDLLLTPDNVRRVTERLAELRGAAMKVGQLLSMEAGDFLPPELTAILARLREEAHAMPLGEVAQVLKSAWGPGWEQRFRRFDFTPMAAASIGQVHRAETRDGRVLAIKIQYPGVKASIDSDVANVATLLRLFGLIPAGLELQPLLEEARRQLHQEADYPLEADRLARYREHLGDDPAFSLPEVVGDWVTGEVLPMHFVPGTSIEKLATAEPALRDAVASRLVGLALTEVLQWGLVQTDPNFANFRYDADSGRIGLLDFGAARDYSPPERDALRQLLSAAVAGDRQAVLEAAEAVGYLQDTDPAGFRDAIADLVLTAAEPARHDGPYRFGRSDLARRMTEKVMQLRVEQRFSRLPPPSVLFLHRKIAGTYLLCARLSASVDVGPLLGDAMARAAAPTEADAPERLRVAG